MRGGKRTGAGRKKGTSNQRTQDLRALMEEITPNNEPVPMVLLRLGFNYHKEKMHSEAIQAISKAMEYAYPKLKQIELSGEVKTAPVLQIVLNRPKND